MCLQAPSGAPHCCGCLQACVTLRYEGLIKGSDEYTKKNTNYTFFSEWCKWCKLISTSKGCEEV